MKFNDLMPKIDTSFIDEINKQNQEMLNNIIPSSDNKSFASFSLG